MITFNYQGQELAGERVNSMDGDLPIVIREDCMVRHQGFEELLRDEEGHHYLRRHLQLCDVDGTTEHPASGRTCVHRVSLTAAVQWTIMRCEAETNHLRRDVAKALAARSVAASHLDSDKVTVPFTLPLDLYRQVLAMAAYDERGDFSDTVRHSLEGDVESWLEAPDIYADPEVQRVWIMERQAILNAHDRLVEGGLSGQRAARQLGLNSSRVRERRASLERLAEVTTGRAKGERIDLGLSLFTVANPPGGARQALSASEIAAWCGCTPAAIQSIERRALRKLHRKLDALLREQVITGDFSGEESAAMAFAA